ncbi:hypothetical protein ACI8AF_11855 [Blastococcus sp. SYSU D00669]
MTTIRTTVAAVLLLVLAACAAPAADDGGGGGGTEGPYPYAADDLVLQVAWTGGFVMPQTAAARLPLVSVYGDGRVLTDGPVPAIYPGPALPNVQVRQIGEDEVQELVDAALEAGVGDTADLGMPPIADVPTTRFTVSTGLETIVREVYALVEGAEDGLTEEQVAARAELRGFLDELTGLGAAATEPYEPAAVAALVTPYAAEPEFPQPDTAWPGPPLPGEPFDEPLGLTCVLAGGEQTAPVLEAARAANRLTPWLSADGARWSLTFRPLLPHETGCADLHEG